MSLLSRIANGLFGGGRRDNENNSRTQIQGIAPPTRPINLGGVTGVESYWPQDDGQLPGNNFLQNPYDNPSATLHGGFIQGNVYPPRLTRTANPFGVVQNDQLNKRIRW